MSVSYKVLSPLPPIKDVKEFLNLVKMLITLSAQACLSGVARERHQNVSPFQIPVSEV